ncbi:MAG: hypothetical protein M3Z96_11270 [Pseudomonadota bacterium]|nr:hypothetical protein [Pseudomonadota bacterium]MDQ6868238.1 hypothetical protein [Pseudomonadota bacterium]
MTVIPFPDRERWRRELSSAAPPAIATDVLAELVFSMILNREAELVALTEADAAAGIPGQKESELDVVRALLRLILAPNVRMPLSRLQ